MGRLIVGNTRYIGVLIGTPFRLRILQPWVQGISAQHGGASEARESDIRFALTEAVPNLREVEISRR